MISAIIGAVLLNCLSNSLFVASQVQTKGRFTPYGYLKSGSFHDVIVEGPKLDSDYLLKATLESERPDPLTHMRPQIPYKFAESVDLQIDITDPSRGTWIEDEANNHRTWRTIVKSAGALSISLLFNNFMLPEDGELYIIGKDETLGAFTAEVNNKVTRKFATTPLAGDSVIVEYHEPLRKKGPSKPPVLQIFKIVHGFRSTAFAYGASEDCHIDVECRKNAKNEKAINSTVTIITNDCTSFCTGTMSREEASYISPKAQTVHGISLITQYHNSDFALLKISERIPDEYNAYLAGWDATMHAHTDVYSVHHPSGDVKKISTYNGQIRITDGITQSSRNTHWLIPSWSEGSTERGSSGSALFNSLGQVIGQLSGGASSCRTLYEFDKYGALFANFNYPPEEIRLSRFLDPDNTGTRVLNGIALNDIHNRGVYRGNHRHNHINHQHIRRSSNENISTIHGHILRDRHHRQARRSRRSQVY